MRSVDCDRARARVSLALDGELSELGHASLRAHVGRCESCASFERDMVALTEAVRTAPPVPFRTTVAPGPRTALAGARLRRRSAKVRVLQVAAAAAAVVLAAGLGSLAGSLSSRTTATATATLARTSGLDLAAFLDRGAVAMAPRENLPASRISPPVAL